MAEKTMKLKKIVRHQSKQQKFFRKYGVALILFFVFALLYFFWTYGVPFIMKSTITDEEVNKIVQSKLGFKCDISGAEYYTTPKLEVGAKFKDVKLVFPEYSVEDKKGLFLKARVISMEVPVLPLLMRTIKFNEFALRTATINLYQNENGQYVYLKTLQTNFNPQMKKFMLEVPDINIYSYVTSNYNSKTKTFKRDRGSIMTIQAAETKEILKNAKHNSIMLR